jgi:hypothetical protein
MLRSDPLLGELTAYAEFPIPRSVYDRLRDDLVTVQIDFALTQLQDQPPILSTLSTIGDSIPALGFCALDQSYSVINCRSAFQEPSQFAIQTYRQIPCTAPGADVEPAFGMVGDFKSTSALPHISSVVVTGLPLSAPRRAGYLCPGAPIKFVEKRFERRLQIRMPVATLQFKGYVGSDKIK